MSAANRSSFVFFADVVRALADGEEILIRGPSVTKLRFLRYAHQHAPGVASRVVLIVILMGVAGSGKTTLGILLARRLGWRFIDADDFHSPQEIQHMVAGQPLSDDERQPWLARLRGVLADCVARKEHAVLACSALKESYRRQLAVDADAVRFVYLKGDPALMRQRLRNRSAHFFKEPLLDSQYLVLEEPADALTVDAGDPPERLAQQISDALGLSAVAWT